MLAHLNGLSIEELRVLINDFFIFEGLLEKSNFELK
jgi:hypothetical protein